MSSVEELCDHISLINKSRTVLDGEVSEIRNRFRSDIISVGFEGDTNAFRNGLNKQFEILSIEENGIGKEARIKIPPAGTSNDLISNLVDITTIHSFNEVIPSMNDIFIQVVESDLSKNGKKK
jgi:ABC-2 type transport system ATP-binding protein